ncbi:MAG: hypothetical protein WBD93_06695 [Acidobacteriaceae bacterium]
MAADCRPVRDPKRIATEILMNDVEIALLSASCVISWEDKKAAAWVIRNTQKTYDSVCERRQTVPLSASEAAYLDDKIVRLRSRLKFLGEPV